MDREKKGAGNVAPNDHCMDCGKQVQQSQQGLACEACGFWHHAECENVTDEVYEFLCDHSEDVNSMVL